MLKEEFEKLRAGLEFKYLKYKPVYIPWTKDSEEVLADMFGKNGKSLASLVHYKAKGKFINIYSFNGSRVIIVKTLPDMVVFGCTRDVDRWFRYALMIDLMELDDDLGKVVRQYGRKNEDVQEISEMWFMFKQGNLPGSFSDWVKDHPRIKYWKEYREKHHLRHN